MTEGNADSLLEPPLDCEELLARIRFSLDAPMPMSQRALKRRIDIFDEVHGDTRASSVRVTEKLMPKLHAAVRQTCERLMLPDEPEVFVKSDPRLNAGALTDGKRQYIVLNSGLVQLLEPEELPAIIGHELGHAFYRHMAIVEEPESDTHAIFSFERSRAQEISADRVGLVSVTDPDFALRAEIKIACGLGAQHFTADIDAFIEQLSETPDEIDSPWETSTHPVLAMRFWAQRCFLESDVFRSLIGKPGGRSLDAIELEIEERFHGAGSSEAFRKTADHVHEALAWLGILLIAQDNEVTTLEHAVLVEFVGKIWADDSYVYAKRHGLKAVERRVTETLAPLRFSNRRTRQRIETAIKELAQRTDAMERLGPLMRLISQAVQPE